MGKQLRKTVLRCLSPIPVLTIFQKSRTDINKMHGSASEILLAICGRDSLEDIRSTIVMYSIYYAVDSHRTFL